MVRGVSESLAVRVGFIDLSGFNVSEVANDRITVIPLQSLKKLPGILDKSLSRSHYNEDGIHDLHRRNGLDSNKPVH